MDRATLLAGLVEGRVWEWPLRVWHRLFWGFTGGQSSGHDRVLQGRGASARQNPDAI